MQRQPLRKRGQVLVLACVTFLVMALMMMASFSVASAVHERIRLQAAADSRAFSAAVLEARAFNTIAYTNRAIAGAIVAELGLHAWYAIALRDVSMYKAGADVFELIVAGEIPLCKKSFKHCVHLFKATKILSAYKSARSKAKNYLDSKRGIWTDAVDGFNQMIRDIHKDQKKMLNALKTQLGDSGSVLATIVKRTAPQSTSLSVAKYNIFGLACAVEGSDFDDQCTSPPAGKTVAPVSAPASRTTVMESAARAARLGFEVGRASMRHLSGDGYQNAPITDFDFRHDTPTPIFNPDKMMDIQGSGLYTESATRPDITISNNHISADIGDVLVMIKWEHWMLPAESKGDKDSEVSHYQGVPCNAGDDSCFINFRSSTIDGATDYGQPDTYSALTQDLRRLKYGARGAWELNDEGTVFVPGRIDGAFRFVPKGNAFAVAKAKVYFHQWRDWSVPPNLFDPFWRAKLQPFKREELAGLLGSIGDVNGQAIITGGQSAVEGVK